MVLGPRRATASAFAEQTRAVLIGIGPYSGRELISLPSPPSDVQSLAAALTSPDGCALPAERVIGIGGDGAPVSRQQVLENVRAAADSTSPGETLVVYFGGHGLTDAEEFYLCTSETRVDDLAGTAIRGTVLAEVLAASQADGIIVLLDCCRSAGFAERAPAFFRELGNSKFRILLAAARTAEPSLELASGAGTLFTRQLIRALAGTEVVGRAPGLIYYSELFSYLDLRIGEEWARLGIDGPAPQPVSISIYARDPLLFVHRGLTLSQVRVREARYSREQITRIVARAAVTAAALIAFAAGTLYTWLDKSEFVQVEPQGIAVYEGVPGVHAFGFPRRRWIAAVEPRFVRPESPLRQKGAALAAPLGGSVAPVIERELQPEGRALLYYRRGDLAAARRETLAFVDSDRFVTNEWAEAAVSMLEELATPADVPLFHRLTKSPNANVRNAAAMALVRHDRNAGLREAAAIISRSNWDADDVYERLTGSCDAAAAAFLQEELQAPYRSLEGILDTATRLQCRLPVTPLLEKLVVSASEDERRRVVQYASWAHGASFDNLLIGLIERGREAEFDDEGAQRYGRLIRAAATLGASPRLCAAARAAHPPDRYLRRSFLLAAIHACPATEFAAIEAEAVKDGANDDIEYLIAAVRRTVLSARTALTRLQKPNVGEIRAIAGVLAERRHAEDVELAKEWLTPGQSELEQPALWILEKNRAAADVPPMVFHSRDLLVQEAAYRWLLTVNRSRAIGELRGRIAEEQADYIPRVLAQVRMTPRELEAFRALETAQGIERRRALEILVLHASGDEALGLLMSPEAFVRDSAAEWVAAREDLHALARRMQERLRAEPTRPCSVQLLRALARRRDSFDAEIARVPPALRRWRTEILIDRVRNEPPGLRHWLERTLQEEAPSTGSSPPRTGSSSA